MIPRDVFRMIDAVFKHYEKGLVALRKETIKTLQQQKEAVFAKNARSQFSKTEKQRAKKRI